MKTKTVTFSGSYIDVMRCYFEWQHYNSSKYVIVEEFSNVSDKRFNLRINYIKRSISEIVPNPSLLKNLSLEKNIMLN